MSLFWTAKGKKNYETKDTTGITVLAFGEWIDGYDNFKEKFSNCDAYYRYRKDAIKFGIIKDCVKKISCPTTLSKTMREEILWKFTNPLKNRSYCWYYKQLYSGFSEWRYEVQPPRQSTLFFASLSLFPDPERHTLTLFNTRWNRVVCINLVLAAYRTFRKRVLPWLIARVSFQRHCKRFQLCLIEMQVLPGSRLYRHAQRRFKRKIEGADGLYLLSQSKKVK